MCFGTSSVRRYPVLVQSAGVLNLRNFWHTHPAGSSSDSDICGRYERFLTSFYNGVYGEILGSHKDQMMAGLRVDCTQK